MALTPDDVVTKQFQHVRFKEGFDPDEVDDFLDEIVVEWRKTIEENEQLKARVAEPEAAAEKAPAAAAAPVTEVPKPKAPEHAAEQQPQHERPQSRAHAGHGDGKAANGADDDASTPAASATPVAEAAVEPGVERRDAS